MQWFKTFEAGKKFTFTFIHENVGKTGLKLTLHLHKLSLLSPTFLNIVE